MLESIAPLLAALRKASPVTFVAMGLATAFVLFAPQSWGTVVGISQFRQQHRELVGVVFLVSWSLLLASGLARGAREATAWNARRHKRRRRKETMTELTPAEKRCLAMYVREDVNTYQFPLDEGVVSGLVAKGILFQACSHAEFHAFPFNMQPWARRYLAAHPGFLDGVPGPPRRKEDNSPVWQ